jgi:hypothetical protein
MLQDQNSQMTNTNKPIIEQIDEQELQDITGGCLGCGMLTAVAGVDGHLTVAKGIMNGSPKEIAKGTTQLLTAFNASATASTRKLPCLNCVANGSLYLFTKIPPKGGK